MPSFVRELHRATSAYMKAASGTTAKAIARHTIQIAKSLATDLIGEKRFRGPTMSDFSDADGGGVYLFSNRFSKRLKESLQESNRQFMEEVFALSQEYVPYDKRYAEAKNLKFLSKAARKNIMSFESKKAYRKYFSGNDYESRTDVWSYRPSDTARILLGRSVQIPVKFVKFTRGRGWYDSQEVDFVESMLRKKQRDVLNRVYYNEETGTVNVRRNTSAGRSGKTHSTEFTLTKEPYKDISKFKRTNVQPSGGYQELKKSGRLTQFGTGYVINYNGYDKTRPSNTFNYAALQHDNTRFKHKYGQSMFLHKAFLHRRRQWYKAIEQSVQNALQNK